MTLILVGLNHRTAPVELREQFALSGCGLPMALESMNTACLSTGGAASPGSKLHEAVIVSTCNRLEIYAVVGGSAENGWSAVEAFLSELQGVPRETLSPHVYRLEGEQAAWHLMRVAAGLDSMILGEPQILGQVTQAHGSAQATNTTGPILSHLFTQAIHAGKRARTETDISRHTTSVSHAAAQLAQEKLGDLTGTCVLVIGAGEAAELAAQALQMHGAPDITCINRTFGRAQALAEKVGGQALSWYSLDEVLVRADVIVSATGAPHTIMRHGDLADILPQRNQRPLVIIDIAVPRDIEESVGTLPDVYYYDVDDLEATRDDNLAQREAAVPAVEAIVSEETAIFMDWLSGREVAPVIAGLRRKANALAGEEVAQALNRLGEDISPREQEIVNRLARRIVNKLLHEPTVRLKEQAANGNGYTYAHAIRELFDLEVEPSSSPNSDNGHGLPEAAAMPEGTAPGD